MTAWVLIPYDHYDKSITLTGPNDMVISVDYDDVDHDAVDAWLPKIVEALNAIEPPVIVRTEEDEEDVVVVSKVDFTYYLHDTHDTMEMLDAIERSAGVELSSETRDQIERPFYEVTLSCTLDTDTGKVEVTGVKL